MKVLKLHAYNRPEQICAVWLPLNELCIGVSTQQQAQNSQQANSPIIDAMDAQLLPSLGIGFTVNPILTSSQVYNMYKAIPINNPFTFLFSPALYKYTKAAVPSTKSFNTTEPITPLTIACGLVCCMALLCCTPL